MSSHDQPPLARAIERERRDLGHDDDKDSDSDTLADAPGLSARKTRIGGEDVDLEDPATSVTFDDENGLLANHGRMRPREFWTAKQLGQTPPMELIKIVVTQQLTGGRPIVTDDDGELSGAVADLGAVIEDIYRGPHFQELNFDNLITATVSDLIDLAWAYWETLPSANGEFPVAGFKPLPPLQIQHNLDDKGEFIKEPAFYHVPFKRSGGTVSVAAKEPTELDREKVVVMRDPQSTRSDEHYGESIATKVREWLEIIIDVDVHQKRHYDDNQLPAGFVHFQGVVGEDKLKEIEQDIKEVSGDPHELVTTTSEDGASWISVGESVVDLEAIQEQQWYYKLVLAAAGLNPNEIGIIEGSGFAKETPALQRAVFKKVTKPMMGAIIEPQNQQVLPRIFDGLNASVDADLRLELERFDPVQEQIEREETITEWSHGGLTLNEFRGALGKEAYEFPVEIGGETYNVADIPKDVLELMKPDMPTLDGLAGDAEGEASGTDFSDGGSHADPGPPDFDQDPVLSEREAFDALGSTFNPQAVRQLSDTIDVASSFIESVAYARPTNFLQIEFERDGTNAVYWYGSVEEYRFQNIIQADSKGKYFNRYIRGEYIYARLQ